jgi:hypothetical protein
LALFSSAAARHPTYYRLFLFFFFFFLCFLFSFFLLSLYSYSTVKRSPLVSLSPRHVELSLPLVPWACLISYLVRMYVLPILATLLVYSPTPPIYWSLFCCSNPGTQQPLRLPLLPLRDLSDSQKLFLISVLVKPKTYRLPGVHDSHSSLQPKLVGPGTSFRSMY